MALTINTNLNALRAVRKLDASSRAQNQVLERLATGQRINRASDDAAGLSVASALNAKSRVYGQAIRNVSDGISYLNVADGAIKELKNILFRVRELSTQASNGTFSNTQRKSLNREVQALQSEYNRTIETTKFNDISVFGPALQLQAGAGTDAVLTVGNTRSYTTWDGTFEQTQTLTTGNSPYSVAAGDLNGDGKIDIISGDNGSGVVSVMLGNGDGTFQNRFTLSSAGGITSVALSDINRDGKVDIYAVTNGRVDVFLGNGNGTFQARKSTTTGPGAFDLGIGDFNNDEIEDIVTANFSDNTISVLIGNGDGTYKAETRYTTGTSPRFVTTSDFNNDGIQDIVSTDNSNHTVSVFLGNGNGTFKARATFVVGYGQRNDRLIGKKPQTSHRDQRDISRQCP